MLIFTFEVYLLKSLIVNHWNVCSLYSNNTIEPPDVSDVRINHGSLLRIGCWGCSQLAEKLHVTILLLQFKDFFKDFFCQLGERNVNISNELNVLDVYQSAYYIGLLAKFK